MSADINLFLAKGGQVKTITPGMLKGYAPAKHDYKKTYDRTLAGSKSYQHLRENGLTPKEAKAFLRGEKIMQQKDCDYR